MIDLRQGNCFEIMQQLIDAGIKVNAIICDPPYNINYDTWDNFDIFKAIDMFDKILLPNSNILIFQGWSNVCTTKQYLDSKGYTIQDWIVYDRVKGRGGKKHLVSTREDILWYTNSKTYTFNKIPSTIKKKTGGLGLKNGCLYRALSNVWTDISPIVPWSSERVKHSTQKPIALMDRLVTIFTNEGDIVLDFCMGSGTTGVSCKKLNRNFIGIELDKDIFEIAKERLNG